MKKFLISKILVPISMSNMDITKMVVTIPFFILMLSFPVLGISVLTDIITYEIGRQVVPYILFPSLAFYVSELGSLILYKLIKKDLKFNFDGSSDLYLFETISLLSCYFIIKLCKDSIFVITNGDTEAALNNDNVKSNQLWSCEFRKFKYNNRVLLLKETNQEDLIDTFESFVNPYYLLIAKNKEAASVVKMVLP